MKGQMKPSSRFSSRNFLLDRKTSIRSWYSGGSFKLGWFAAVVRSAWEL
jgi:hypothetical protein